MARSLFVQTYHACRQRCPPRSYSRRSLIAIFLIIDQIDLKAGSIRSGCWLHFGPKTLGNTQPPAASRSRAGGSVSNKQTPPGNGGQQQRQYQQTQARAPADTLTRPR